MDNFQEIMDFIVQIESKKTVGILLKRIELMIEEAKQEKRDYLTFKDAERLKAQIKESIYEAYRNIRDFLNTGKIILNFKQSKE